VKIASFGGEQPLSSFPSHVLNSGAPCTKSLSIPKSRIIELTVDEFNEQCLVDQIDMIDAPSPRATAMSSNTSDISSQLAVVTQKLTANSSRYLEQATQMQLSANEIGEEIIESGGFPFELRETFDDFLEEYRGWAEEVVRNLNVDDRIHLEEAKMIGEQFFRSIYDPIRETIELEQQKDFAKVIQVCENFPNDVVYNYTDDLVILYEMGLYAQPYVDSIVKYIKNRLAIDESKEIKEEAIGISSNKVKRLGRAVEKIFHASTDENYPSRLTDLARGMVVFKSMLSMARALEIIQECAEITILRVKDRWSDPTSFGWADILISFEFNTGHPAEQHVCELQFVHDAMVHTNLGRNAHVKFLTMRTCTELLDMFRDANGTLFRITEGLESDYE